MSFAKRQTVSVTTDSSGDATVSSGTAANGRIISIKYTKPGASSFTDGVVFLITTKDTAQTLWSETAVNASATVAPRQPTHSTLGAASFYAAAGEPVEDHIWAVDEEIEIVIASGGNAKTGTFDIIIG